MDEININNQSSFSKFYSQIKKSEKNIEKLITIFNSEKMNEIIKEILSKKNRTENELLIIKLYIKTLSKFIEI